MMPPDTTTGIDVRGKTLDLARLLGELQAAMIAASIITQSGDWLVMRDADGEIITPTPEAEAVVAAHDGTPRAASVEQQADTERLLLVHERAQTDPAFAALAELALRGVTTTGGAS